MDVDKALRRAAKQLKLSLADEEIPDVSQRAARPWMVPLVVAAVSIVVVGGVALITSEDTPAPLVQTPVISTPSTTTTLDESEPEPSNEPRPVGPDRVITQGEFEGTDETWTLSVFLTESDELCMRLRGMTCGPVPDASTPLPAPSRTVSDIPGKPRLVCTFGALHSTVADVVLTFSDGSTATAPVYAGGEIPANFFAQCWTGDLDVVSAVAIDTDGMTLASSGDTDWGGSLYGADGLAADLATRGFTVDATGSFTPRFLGGRGLTYCIGGQEISIWEYPSQADREAASDLIDRDDPSHIGNAWVAWRGNPTFWQHGTIVVLYLGNQAETLDVLNSVLGPSFAEGRGRSSPNSGDCVGESDARVAESPSTSIETPDGWIVVAELLFGVTDRSVIESVDGGVVVVQRDSTEFIGLDGSRISGDGSPLVMPSSCCGGVAGLPAGASLVLIDSNSSDTWVLDVDSLTWHEADPRPAQGYVLGSALIDGQLYVVIAAPRSEETSSPLMVLDLETGAWTELEPVPSPISVGGVTNDGNRLIVSGTRQGPNNDIIGGRNPVVYEYIRGEDWHQIADAPIDGQASTIVWVHGSGLVAWNYDLESALLDESGEWERLGDVPMRFGECYPQSVSTTAGAAASCGGVAWFSSASEKWIPIRSPFNTRIATTESALFGFVELGPDHTQLITYQLPPREG